MLQRQVVVHIAGYARCYGTANASATREQHGHDKLLAPEVVKGPKPAEVDSRLRRIGASPRLAIDRFGEIKIGAPSCSVFHGSHHSRFELRNQIGDVQGPFDPRNELLNFLIASWILQVVHCAAVRDGGYNAREFERG